MQRLNDLIKTHATRQATFIRPTCNNAVNKSVNQLNGIVTMKKISFLFLSKISAKLERTQIFISQNPVPKIHRYHISLTFNQGHGFELLLEICLRNMRYPFVGVLLSHQCNLLGIQKAIYRHGMNAVNHTMLRP